jgi:hypothetical protein
MSRNSKQITAVLTLKEVEKGKLICKAQLENICRTYRSYRHRDSSPFIELSAGITDIDKPLIFRPGSDFNGNTTYIMLGKIIEKLQEENI